MANIFSDFWYRINKKLVPRNSKVTETSSDFIVELQNANEDKPADRETLVSFSIPKGTSFTPQDRQQVNAALETFKNVSSISSDQWAALKEASKFENRIAATERNIDTEKRKISTIENKTNLMQSYTGGVLVAKAGAAVGALVNADGSFDAVSVTWANDKPTVSGILSSFDTDSMTIGTSTTSNASVELAGGTARFYVGSDGTSKEIRLNSNNNATIIIGPDDKTTFGGLTVKSSTHTEEGLIEAQLPFNVQRGLTVNELKFSNGPVWQVGRYVSGKCNSVYCVQGGMVFWSVHIDDGWWSLPAWQWTNIGGSLFSDVTGDSTTGVPSNLRPAKDIWFTATNYNGNSFMGVVYPDGTVMLHPPNGTEGANNWSFSVSWPIGGSSMGDIS